MNKTILTLRILFFLLCIVGSYLVSLAVPDWSNMVPLAIFIGACIGALVILTDIFLKGFSLRGLTALSFGLFIGWVISTFIASSPLFEQAEEEYVYLVRLSLYVILMYLGAVIALRGRDEFNLVIPYVRFVPHGVEVPLVVVDTSALIDGRIYDVCATKFLGYALVIPRFVLEELHQVADSSDPQRQAKGRKGLDILNKLRSLKNVDLRIHESDVEKHHNVDAKLIFLAQQLKAKLLTTDYNLARMAEFQNVDWLNLNQLAKALNQEIMVGEYVEVELLKQGKEQGQAVGYLADGSMVVVNDGARYLGDKVEVEVQSIIPSAGGKMIFGRRRDS